MSKKELLHSMGIFVGIAFCLGIYGMYKAALHPSNWSHSQFSRVLRACLNSETRVLALISLACIVCGIGYVIFF